MNHQKTSLGRRDFLRLGGIGAAGVALPRALAAGFAPRSLILIWQAGGCSHLDTFDMKPSAPREVRGEFRPIRTSVPGIEICEHLPRTAKLAHRFAIVRSMQGGETNHERARRYLETGMPLSPDRAFPTLSEVLGSGPAAAGYGESPLGLQCLRARRAVEGGAPIALVRHEDYDTHAGNFHRLKNVLLPQFDRAFSTLLLDLEGRGLLATTLVAVMGEFGRSPRINAQGGRDHHARAFSVLLAGAGVPGGQVIGATDETGSEVVDSPVAPQDLLRTICEIVRPTPSLEHAASPMLGNGRAIPALTA